MEAENVITINSAGVISSSGSGTTTITVAGVTTDSFGRAIPCSGGGETIGVVSSGGWPGSSSTTILVTCAGCGQQIVPGCVHWCSTYQGLTSPGWNGVASPTQERKPHKCPVCDGKRRVLFDPEHPHASQSNVRDWPCAVCSETGLVWG